MCQFWANSVSSFSSYVLEYSRCAVRKLRESLGKARLADYHTPYLILPPNPQAKARNQLHCHETEPSESWPCSYS